jgi:hypothetical protein
VTKELRREKEALKTPKERMPKERMPKVAKMRKMTKREEKLHAVGEEPIEVPEALVVMRKEEVAAVIRKKGKKTSAADSVKDLVAEVVVVAVVEEEKEELAEVKVRKVTGTL